MSKEKYSPMKVVDVQTIGEGPEWHEYRRKGVGGSDVSALVGCSPWTTKRALYYSKMGLDKSSPNPYTLDFGHAMEPFVAAWFQRCFDSKYKGWLEKHLGKQIKSFNIYLDPWMYKHPIHQFMQANLDYRWECVTTDGELIEGVFECKTTTYHTALEKWGDDKVPPYYELQCRHYMAIMNLDYSIIACAWGNNEADYAVGFVERDYNIENDIIALEKDFWENNVLKHVAPPLSEERGELEYAALQDFKIEEQVRQGKLPEIAITDDDMLISIEDYLSLMESKKQLEEEVKALSNKLQTAKVKALTYLAQKNTDKLILKDTGYIIKNTDSSRTTIDSKLLKEKYPNIYEEVKKVSTSKRFSISPPKD